MMIFTSPSRHTSPSPHLMGKSSPKTVMTNINALPNFPKPTKFTRSASVGDQVSETPAVPTSVWKSRKRAMFRRSKTMSSVMDNGEDPSKAWDQRKTGLLQRIGSPKSPRKQVRRIRRRVVTAVSTKPRQPRRSVSPPPQRPTLASFGRWDSEPTLQVEKNESPTKPKKKAAAVRMPKKLSRWESSPLQQKSRRSSDSSATPPRFRGVRGLGRSPRRKPTLEVDGCLSPKIPQRQISRNKDETPKMIPSPFDKPGKMPSLEMEEGNSHNSDRQLRQLKMKMQRKPRGELDRHSSH